MRWLLALAGVNCMSVYAELSDVNGWQSTRQIPDDWGCLSMKCAKPVTGLTKDEEFALLQACDVNGDYKGVREDGVFTVAVGQQAGFQKNYGKSFRWSNVATVCKRVASCNSVHVRSVGEITGFGDAITLCQDVGVGSNPHKPKHPHNGYEDFRDELCVIEKPMVVSKHIGPTYNGNAGPTYNHNQGPTYSGPVNSGNSYGPVNSGNSYGPVNSGNTYGPVNSVQQWEPLGGGSQVAASSQAWLAMATAPLACALLMAMAAVAWRRSRSAPAADAAAGSEPAVLEGLVPEEPSV